MDVKEVRVRLQYVIELLEDIQHYHHSSSHLCPCDVCSRKYSLSRSSIGKAMEEVAAVLNNMEIGYTEERSNKPEAAESEEFQASPNLNFSCSLVSDMHKVCKGNKAEAGHTGVGLDVQCVHDENNTAVNSYGLGFYTSPMSEVTGSMNLENYRKRCHDHNPTIRNLESEVVQPTQSDHIDNRSPQPQLFSPSMRQAKRGSESGVADAANDISPRFGQILGRKREAQTDLSRLPSPSVHPQSSSNPPSYGYLPHPSNIFPIPGEPLSLHLQPPPAQRTISPQHLPSFSWMPEMLFPYHYIPYLPPPNFIHQELERYRRYSDEILHDTHYRRAEAMESFRNRTFSHYGRSPSVKSQSIHHLNMQRTSSSQEGMKQGDRSLGQPDRFEEQKDSARTKDRRMSGEQMNTPAHQRNTNDFSFNINDSQFTGTPLQDEMSIKQGNRSLQESHSVINKEGNSSSLGSQSVMKESNSSSFESQNVSHSHCEKTDHTLKARITHDIVGRQAQTNTVLPEASLESQSQIQGNITHMIKKPQKFETVVVNSSAQIETLAVGSSNDAAVADEGEKVSEMITKSWAGDRKKMNQSLERDRKPALLETCNASTVPSSIEREVNRYESHNDKEKIFTEISSYVEDGYVSIKTGTNDLAAYMNKHHILRSTSNDVKIQPVSKGNMKNIQYDSSSSLQLPPSSESSSNAFMTNLNEGHKSRYESSMKSSCKTKENKTYTDDSIHHYDNESISDSMWRPWEAKVNILGLIQSGSDDEEGLQEDCDSKISNKAGKSEHGNSSMSGGKVEKSETQKVKELSGNKEKMDEKKTKTFEGKMDNENQISEDGNSNRNCTKDQSEVSDLFKGDRQYNNKDSCMPQKHVDVAEQFVLKNADTDIKKMGRESKRTTIGKTASVTGKPGLDIKSSSQSLNKTYPETEIILKDKSSLINEDKTLKCLANIDHTPRTNIKVNEKIEQPGSPSLPSHKNDLDQEKENSPIIQKQKSKPPDIEIIWHSEPADVNWKSEGYISSSSSGTPKMGIASLFSFQDSSSKVSPSTVLPKCDTFPTKRTNLRTTPPPSGGSLGAGSFHSSTQASVTKEIAESPPNTAQPNFNQGPQWGAPALQADLYMCKGAKINSSINLNRNDTDIVETLSESFDSHCNVKDGKSSQTPQRRVTILPPPTIVTDDQKASPQIKESFIHKENSTIPIEEKHTNASTSTIKPKHSLFASHRDKAYLNQSMPLSCDVQERGINTELQVPRLMNESYEANQSFPKMAKPQRTEADPSKSAAFGFAGTAGEQDVVTDLNQIKTPKPAVPVPRNRRSIFGFSPPDPHQGQGHKSMAAAMGEAQCGGKRTSDPSEAGYLEMLWSHLDATTAIGQIAMVEEILFNCVTHSLCVVDPQRNGRIISVNESFQFMIGVHEKVVGQRLFRFLKVKDSLDDLGTSLPQSFVLADGRQTSVTGKLMSCVDARGEEIPVTVWAVPFSLRPEFLMCVIGVAVPLTADVYVSRNGNVLMYSEPFEDIMGVTRIRSRDSAEGICCIPGLNVAESRPQHAVIQALDGCSVPVTVTMAETAEDEEDFKTVEENGSAIYQATISVAANVAGLISVQSDGFIKSCDKNFVRINLGHCNLDNGKHKLANFLRRVVKIGQGSAPSSHNSSPANQDKSRHGCGVTLADVSRLEGKTEEGNDEEETGLRLPRSCFSGVRDVDLHTDDEECDDTDSIRTESDSDDSDDQQSFVLPVGARLAPHHTSTPCKHGQLAKREDPHDDVVLENGIYAAHFLHGNGSWIPVTFKLGCVQSSDTGWLFCLWMYVQPCSKQDGDDPAEDDEEEEEEEDADSDEDDRAEVTCDEVELRRRLKHLQFDQSVDRTVDASLGHMIMEQAGLNQSHNATSGADMLDLEAAISGTFSEHYVVCEALGQGSFGFVRRARNVTSGQSAVVKFIKKSKMFDDSWMADKRNKNKLMPLEVLILQEVNCDYIVKVLDVHENSSFVQMVMEDFGELDLFDFIDQVDIDEPLACYLFRQILWAVEYLHARKIVHRDIKDENVIVHRDFHCKLIDFGSAAYMLPKGQLFTRFRGTIEYCSPEVYRGEWYRGTELDIWALGVTLYTIVFRENPFTPAEEPGGLCEANLPHPISHDLRELLFGLLEPDLTRRLTMSKAVTADWLRQIVDMSQYDWLEMFGDGSEEADLKIDFMP